MSATTPARPHTKWTFATLFGVLGGVIVGVLLLAFVWPSATVKARDLPVGIDGPTAQVSALEKAFRAQSTDPFTFVSVGSRASAVHRIKTREIYGAILLGDHPEILTSSAGSSVANQLLRSVAGTLQAEITAGTEKALEAKIAQLAAAAANPSAKAAAGSTGSGSAASAGSSPAAQSAATTPPQVVITDVVALSKTDPTGAGLGAASFPLVLGGILGGVVMTLLVVGVIRRLLGLLVYAVVAGSIAALIMNTWLGLLQGDWLLTASAFGLAMLATAALIVGLNALIGSAGIGVGSVLTMLIGNPLSAATLPYQFIAPPWGDVGQYFVAGAAASLIRSLSYFPEVDMAKQWLVLAAWAAGGLVLAVVGHFRSAQPIALPARELASMPAHRAGDPVVAR